VEPFDQVFPVASEEVNVTEPPAQKVVAPLGVITGTDGTGFTVTTAGAEVTVHAPLS
jgi:hypothetical protein